MYDVIVVGAGCAGAATAMLLARSGRRVLVIDRDRLPSDAVWTHVLDHRAVALLSRWHLVDGLLATGCPGGRRTVVVAGSTRQVWPSADAAIPTYSPSRSALDGLLLDAALRAGGELRQGFTVRDLLWEDGRVVGVVGHGVDGHSTYERARIVIGADGRNSTVARIAGADGYDERPSTSCCYYARWRGCDEAGPELYLDDGLMVTLLPTNGGLVSAAVLRPVGEWVRFKRAPEATYLAQLLRRHDLARRFGEASRESRCFGTADLGTSFRRPYGPGWALVGDAGHHRPPVWPGGIAEILADAEELVVAIGWGLDRASSAESALAAHHRGRDARAAESCRLACVLASFEWTSADVGRVLEELRTPASSSGSRLPVAT